MRRNCKWVATINEIKPLGLFVWKWPSQELHYSSFNIGLEATEFFATFMGLIFHRPFVICRLSGVRLFMTLWSLTEDQQFCILFTKTLFLIPVGERGIKLYSIFPVFSMVKEPLKYIVLHLISDNWLVIVWMPFHNTWKIAL